MHHVMVKASKMMISRAARPHTVPAQGICIPVQHLGRGPCDLLSMLSANTCHRQMLMLCRPLVVPHKLSLLYVTSGMHCTKFTW